MLGSVFCGQIYPAGIPVYPVPPAPADLTSLRPGGSLIHPVDYERDILRRHYTARGVTAVYLDVLADGTVRRSSVARGSVLVDGLLVTSGSSTLVDNEREAASLALLLFPPFE